MSVEQIGPSQPMHVGLAIVAVTHAATGGVLRKVAEFGFEFSAIALQFCHRDPFFGHYKNKPPANAQRITTAHDGTRQKANSKNPAKATAKSFAE